MRGKLVHGRCRSDIRGYRLHFLHNVGVIVAMLKVAQRSARNGASVRQWMRRNETRAYSALSSSIKISSVPAPHSGSITVLSLNRPQGQF
jgi:hypothetical protein